MANFNNTATFKFTVPAAISKANYTELLLPQRAVNVIKRGYDMGLIKGPTIGDLIEAKPKMRLITGAGVGTIGKIFSAIVELILDYDDNPNISLNIKKYAENSAEFIRG